VIHVRSAVGGGASPLEELDSWAVAASPTDGAGESAEALDQALRAAEPAVVGRIFDDKLVLDVRTLRDDDIELVHAAFAATKTVVEGRKTDRPNPTVGTTIKGEK
jgi:L-seryl-tRNA(Ser) seleniumtransferase